jgi:hypothetical protein
VTVNGLTFAGEATVKDLTVTAFQYNIYIARANAIVTLDNVKSIRARYYGMYVYSTATAAKVSLLGKDLEFTGNASTSIVLGAAMTTLTAMSEGTIALGTNASAIAANAMKVTMSLTGLNFTGTTAYNAIQATFPEANVKLDKIKSSDGVTVTDPMSTLEITGSTIALPAMATGTAVQFAGSKLTIRGSTISGGYYGVQQNIRVGFTSEAVVRDTTIMGYTYYGYYLQGGKLDLGSMTERGNNTFMGPDTAGRYGLYDGRGAAIVSITVSNTTFNGLRPPPAKVTGPADMAGKYRIATAGNVIEFFEL